MAVVLKKKAERYGRLTVLSKDAGWHACSDGTRTRLWRFRCDCGVVVLKTGSTVKCGRTRSCGCGMRENRLANMRKSWDGRRAKHLTKLSDGMVDPMYGSYSSMLARCYQPNSISYPRYGGRNDGSPIGVCDRWCGPNGFDNFYDDMAPRPVGKSLHRIDGDGDYSPENCTWASPVEQANHKRNNHRLTLGDETHTIAEWARITGLAPFTIRKRLKLKWSVEDTLTRPIGVTAGVYWGHKGLRLNIAAWSRKLGIPSSTIRYRVKVGWPLEAALTLPAGSKLKDWKPCKDTA